MLNFGLSFGFSISLSQSFGFSFEFKPGYIFEFEFVVLTKILFIDRLLETVGNFEL